MIFTALLTTCAILLNIYLIPLFGMNGSALSNLISYAIYISILLILIKWKIGTNPLSWAQLKVALIIVSIFLLNIAWIHTLYPLFDRLPFSPKINAIIDGIVKTLVLGGAGIAAIYYWKISAEVNHIAQQVWNKFKNR